MFRTFCQTQMPASEKQTLAQGIYYSLIQDWFLDAGIQDCFLDSHPGFVIGCSHPITIYTFRIYWFELIVRTYSLLNFRLIGKYSLWFCYCLKFHLFCAFVKNHFHHNLRIQRLILHLHWITSAQVWFQGLIS